MPQCGHPFGHGVQAVHPRPIKSLAGSAPARIVGAILPNTGLPAINMAIGRRQRRNADNGNGSHHCCRSGSRHLAERQGCGIDALS
jgi:hypothetical protein